MGIISDSSDVVTAGPNTMDEEGPNMESAMKKSAIVALVLAAFFVTLIVLGAIEVCRVIFASF